MSFDSSWTRRLALGLYHRRWPHTVGVLLLTILAAGPAATVDVETSVQHWFAEGDPALQSYHDFQADYGNDEVVLIGLHRNAGILTSDGLRILDAATERVEGLAGIRSVQSLTTQSRIQTSIAGARLVSLIPPDVRSRKQATRIRERILADSTYARFVSDEGTVGAVYAQMKPNVQIDGRRGAILDSVRHVLDPLDATVHLAGTGVILNAISEATTQDMFVFLVLSSLAIVILLWVYFRRPLPVLITVGIVGATTLWLMGLYGLAGRSINMVTLVMPTLVLVVCTANCVHVLVYAAQQPDALSPRRRTVRTLDSLATPCLLTTLTTAAGFASLLTSSMPVIRDLGFFSAVGVVIALVLTFVGCAGALPYDRALPDRPRNAPLERATASVVDVSLRRWGVVLGITGILVGGALLGLPRISVDTNHFDYLFYDHEVRQDSRLIERTLGPYAPLEFIVQRNSGDAFGNDSSHAEMVGRDRAEEPRTRTTSHGGRQTRVPFGLRPELLEAVADWGRQAVATGAVDWHRSPAEDLKRLHAALPNGAPSIPRDPGRLQGLVRLGQGAIPSLDELMAHPNQVRVTFGIPIQSANGVRKAVDSVQAAGQFPEYVSTRATGFLPLYVRMMSLLVDALVSSFGLALLVIVGMIGLIFHSVRAAALSLIPNVLPILLTLGLMGWSGIPLNVATMTIAAVVFGLVVDDTIHVLRHYVTARRNKAPVPAIRESAQHTGRRMTITTSVLAVGFLVLCVAQIKSIVWVGLLSAIAIIVALAADLMVLPAVLAGMYGDRT